MKTLRDRSWVRRGFSLLWEPRVLAEIASPNLVCSIREFFEIGKAWPADLPAAENSALVVAGLEGCLDSLSENDAVTWLENDLQPAIRKFQAHYGLEAALIMWIASGRTRVGMELVDEKYFWKTSPGRDAARLPLGRCLFGGAEGDAARILQSNEKDPDCDGDSYVGLYHPRIS
jgi:hypothetical protein